MGIRVNLEPELARVREKVNELLDTIDSDVRSRGVFHGGIAVEAKGKKVPRLLEAECQRLIQNYHSRYYTKTISKFIQAERDRVTATFSRHSFSEPRYAEFDRHIDNLIDLLTSRARLARRQSRRMPIWLSTLIIAVVAGVIVVALTPWAQGLIWQSSKY